MSTSDTPNIDDKKQTNETTQNKFNVPLFLKNVANKLLHLLIYIFLAAYVLYSCKLTTNLANPNSRQHTIEIFDGKLIKEPESNTGKNVLLISANKNKVGIAGFMAALMLNVYNYNNDAFNTFFTILNGIDNNYLIAIIGPILFLIFAMIFTIVGIVIFIYYYISLLISTPYEMNFFFKIIVIFIFIILLFCFFTVIPIIQLFFVLYCIVTNMSRPSKIITHKGVFHNFLGFVKAFIPFFKNIIMVCATYIVVTNAFNYLGSSSGVISIIIVLLIYLHIININLFNFSNTKK
jgi:hypothetical protein